MVSSMPWRFAAIGFIAVGAVSIALALARQGDEASDAALPVLSADCSKPPEPPVNLRYTKAGSDVRGFWDPPRSGETPTWYVIEIGNRNRSDDRSLHIVPATQTSFGAPTPAGAYSGRVYARNGCGSSPASNEITYAVP